MENAFYSTLKALCSDCLINYNMHLVSYLKKQRQLDNGIWSVNRVQYEKCFSGKIIHTICGRNQSQTFFKISKFSISLDQQSEVSYSLLLLYVQVEDCNHGHNILRLFDTLPNFLFTTSEINMVYTRCLTSCRTTQDLRKFGKITKISKLH